MHAYFKQRKIKITPAEVTQMIADADLVGRGIQEEGTYFFLLWLTSLVCKPIVGFSLISSKEPGFHCCMSALANLWSYSALYSGHTLGASAGRWQSQFRRIQNVGHKRRRIAFKDQCTVGQRAAGTIMMNCVYVRTVLWMFCKMVQQCCVAIARFEKQCGLFLLTTCSFVLCFFYFRTFLCRMDPNMR